MLNQSVYKKYTTRQNSDVFLDNDYLWPGNSVGLQEGNRGLLGVGGHGVLCLHPGTDFIGVFSLSKLIAPEKAHSRNCAFLNRLQ